MSLFTNARKIAYYIESGTLPGDSRPAMRPAPFEAVLLKADGTDYTRFFHPIGIGDAGDSGGITDLVDLDIPLYSDWHVRADYGVTQSIEVIPDVARNPLDSDDWLALHQIGNI